MKTAFPIVAVLSNRDQPLAAHAVHLISEAQRQLANAPSSFPSGTDHTGVHTTTVEHIARMFLSDSFLDLLSAHELFYLALSFHFHDFGMVGTVADDATAEGREQTRHDHAIRIGELIKQRWKELGFESKRHAEILAEICRGHRPTRNSDNDAMWEDLNEHEILMPGVSIRVRLISALIYAIDELHLGADRASKRIQDWREITDQQSRQHWVRHQAINGPAQIRPGVLTLQINVETPGIEENIRSQVLLKALRAVQELKQELKRENIDAELPAIELQWNRMSMWQTLIPVAIADMKGRSKPDIAQATKQLFQTMIRERTVLDGLAFEKGSTDPELDSSLNRCIDDEIKLAHISSDPVLNDIYRLSVNEKVGTIIQERMRHADDTDDLFVGQYRIRWEQQLFLSQFGKEFITHVAFPVLERTYSVNLRQLPVNDPLRVIIERSPSAVRLALEYRPVSSSLVKTFLLKQVSHTGAFFDSFNDPELILDNDFRKSLRLLADSSPECASMLRFLEEMALVGGFSQAQISTMVGTSEAAQIALNEAMGMQSQQQITISQQLPKKAPLVISGLGNLLMASRRAGTPVHIIAEPGHELRVNLMHQNDSEPLPTTPAMIGIAPRQPPLHPPFLQLPGKLSINKSTRTVRVLLSRFSDPSSGEHPITFRIPVPVTGKDAVPATLSTMARWHLIRVCDIRNMVTVNRMVIQGGVRFELLLDNGTNLLSTVNLDPGSEGCFACGEWQTDALKALTGLEGNLPAPLFMPETNLIAIGKKHASERAKFWKDLENGALSAKRLFNALVLQFADAAGNIVDDEFLDFHPGDIFGPPPQASLEGNISQNEVEQLWHEGGICLSGYFQPDVFELAQKLREWVEARNQQKTPFPFTFTDDAPTTPGIRSSLTMMFTPIVDCRWHRLRTVTFQLRPVTPSEHYRLEAEYWKSIHDEKRAGLAIELSERLSK